MDKTQCLSKRELLRQLSTRHGVVPVDFNEPLERDNDMLRVENDVLEQEKMEVIHENTQLKAKIKELLERLNDS